MTGTGERYQSVDGLSLFYQQVGVANQGLPILCMHGLTRNSRDFSFLAAHLAKDYRLIIPDVRGRGESDYDPKPENYTPKSYIDDMWTLLDHLNIERAILVGTSMGGIMGMLMASLKPDRVAGLVLNDVGPEVESDGIERIKKYVGDVKPLASWDEVVAAQKVINEEIFPSLTDEEWLSFAKCLYKEKADHSLIADYDPQITQMFGAEQPDLWPLYQTLLPIPTMVIQGLRSDILSERIVSKMKKEKPDLVVIKVADRGHAPLLNEPEVIAGLQQFLPKLF